MNWNYFLLVTTVLAVPEYRHHNSYYSGDVDYNRHDPHCQWIGHCLNDYCTHYDECDRDLICTHGKCSAPPAYGQDYDEESEEDYDSADEGSYGQWEEYNYRPHHRSHHEYRPVKKHHGYNHKQAYQHGKKGTQHRSHHVEYRQQPEHHRHHYGYGSGKAQYASSSEYEDDDRPRAQAAYNPYPSYGGPGSKPQHNGNTPTSCLGKQPSLAWPVDTAPKWAIKYEWNCDPQGKLTEIFTGPGEKPEYGDRRETIVTYPDGREERSAVALRDEDED